MPHARPNLVLRSLLGAVAAMAAILLVGGWTLGFDFLLGTGPIGVRAVPTTLACIAMLALGGIALDSADPATRSAGRAYVMTAAILCLINLFLRLTWMPRGLDGLFFGDSLNEAVMGYGTVLGVLLIAVCLWPGSKWRLPVSRDTVATTGFSTMAGLTLYLSMVPEPTLPLFGDTSRLSTLMMGLLFLGVMARDYRLDSSDDDDPVVSA